MRNLPKGKGLWVWQTAATCGGSPETLADKAADLGLGHVLFKILDGDDKRINDLAFVRRVKPLLDAKGIQTIPWGYFWYAPGSPHHCAPETMASAAVDACRLLGCDIFVVNAEKEMKAAGMAKEAERFLAAFRLRSNDISLGLSTFASRQAHPNFPYKAWLEGVEPEDVDFIMPQCYGSNPVAQCEKALLDLSQWGEAVIPTLRAYVGDGINDWKSVVVQMNEFREKIAPNITACNWWVWQAAEKYMTTLSMIRTMKLKSAPQGAEQLRDALPLRYYSKGPNVATLQAFLNAVRKGKEGLLMDGVAGPKTDAAVEEVFGFRLLR